MKDKEMEYEKVDRGGCTVFGHSIVPTLISGYYKMLGSTQDGMTVVILGEEDERKKDF